MKVFLLTLAALAVTATLQAKVAGKTVDYKDGDTVLEGYVAYDDSCGGQAARDPGGPRLDGHQRRDEATLRHAGGARIRGLRRRHLRQGRAAGRPRRRRASWRANTRETGPFTDGG